MKKFFLYTLSLLLSAQVASAQKINRDDFGEVDKYVASIGPMEGSMLKTIVDTLTRRQQAPKVDQVRAMYVWVAQNIDYNCAGERHKKNYNPSASIALNERKTTAEGYANLFKAMCDLARFECVIVKGTAKTDSRSISNVGKNDEHTWNAVKIDKTWYLIDLPMSAGYTDRKCKFYTKSFSDAWFFPDRELFALTHYPQDKKWQLLDTPINKSVYSNAPIIGRSAFINEVYPSTPRAIVKGKDDTTKKMVFDIGNPDRIKSVTVTGRTSKKVPAKYTLAADSMIVEVPFTSEGKYPFNIYINDELAYTYKAEVSEAKKKPKPKPQPKKKTSSSTAKKKTEAKPKATADAVDASTSSKKEKKDKKKKS